jgi:hypothetical protein
MVLTSTKTHRSRAPRPAAPMAAAPKTASPDTNAEPSRPASALDDSGRAAQRARPSTTPAYYLGRPAWYWLALCRRANPGGGGK